jgi:hypothetical protein
MHDSESYSAEGLGKRRRGAARSSLPSGPGRPAHACRETACPALPEHLPPPLRRSAAIHPTTDGGRTRLGNHHVAAAVLGPVVDHCPSRVVLFGGAHTGRGRGRRVGGLGFFKRRTKNPSHNRKVHLLLSPTVQSCIDCWLIVPVCCSTNLEAATTAR